ncbi:hypothetical protein ACHAXN_005718, partial [Cyclotella atomus]
GRPLVDAVVTDLKQQLLYYDDPLLLSVPYEYITKAKIEPPERILYDVIAFTALLNVFMISILRGYIWLLFQLFYKKISRHINHFLHWLRGRVRGNTPIGKTEGAGTGHVCLTLNALSKERFAFLAENIADAYLTSWDSDGIYFCIDNCATCIICNERSMFVGDLKPSNSEVLTSNGRNVPATEGTIRIVLDDDEGVSYTYDIPGALYDPESPFNLLGIPYLSKFFGDAKEMGTKVTSGCYKSHLVWDHENHSRHFSHGVDCLPALQVNVGQSYFTSFCARVRQFYDDNVRFSFRTKAKVRFNPLLPPTRPTKKRKYCDTDFEEGMVLIYKDGSGLNRPVEGAVADGLTHRIRLEDGNFEDVDASHLLLMHQPDLTYVPRTPLDYQNEIKQEYLSAEDAIKLARPRTLSPTQQPLMNWHHRLYHLPFRRIFLLAEKGWLPKRLLDCRDNIPLCVACQFGSAHRRPWRFKGKKSGSIRKKEETKPGDGQSLDQLVSAQPGLIPQMSGFLTSSCYWGATIVIDHVSNFVYCHLMKALTLDETIEAKKSWEILLHQAGHTASHYHADNGRFADVDFIKHCKVRNQSLSFCGVGAHHQNGIVEEKIKV